MLTNIGNESKITTMKREQTSGQRGQSFMELAIFLPILLLMLGGMVEVTLTFNDYLQMLDAARYGARSISDSNPYPADFPMASGTFNPNSPSAYDTLTDTTTLNPFRIAAYNAEFNLNPLISLKTSLKGDGTSNRNDCSTSNTNTTGSNTYRDDVVVSLFATNVISSTSTIQLTRFKSNAVDGIPLTGHLVADTTESGWSYKNQMCSAIKTADLGTKLLTTAPNTGFLIVEVFYNRPQVLNLPGLGSVIPNPLPLHAYAIFPLVAVEPTSTPTP